MMQDAALEPETAAPDVARRGAFTESRIWYRRVGRVLDSVCCVKIDDQPAGSGFLVGPDCVLTNYHVVQNILGRDGRFARPVVCAFDYAKRATGAVASGLEVRVERCVDSSPYGDMEASETPFAPPPPSEDQLDYALLLLDRKIGEEPRASACGSKRASSKISCAK